MLWSIFLTSGKPVDVNSPYGIRVKNAALNNNITDFGRTTVRLDYKSPNIKDGSKSTNMTLLCSLIPGKIEHALLDLEISPGEECTFSVIGNNDIYVAGIIEGKITPIEKPSILSPKYSNSPSATTSLLLPGSPHSAPALHYQEKQIGSVGRPVKNNDIVSIWFVGRVQNILGRVFGKTDSQPYTFTVGSPNSMSGLSRGIIGMRVGGERRIFISAEEGFGENGASGVPPNTDLVIDVQLKKIEGDDLNLVNGGRADLFGEKPSLSQQKFPSQAKGDEQIEHIL